TPRYRWCRECFKRDETPYLRWFWRLSALTWCPVHARLLSEACPICGAPLLLHTSRLVGSGRHGQASTLAHCDSCGMSLRESAPRWKVTKDGGTAKLEILLSRLGELHQFIDAVTAERARSYLAPMLPRVSKEEKRKALRISLGKIVDTRPYRATEELTAKELKKRLLYEKAWLRSIQCRERLLMTLGHNTALSKNYSAYRKKAKKIHWSWKLDANARVTMAALLYITRQEKLAARENKEES
ncbi:MAG: TniQ family protein, partial [Comamonas sp.]